MIASPRHGTLIASEHPRTAARAVYRRKGLSQAELASEAGVGRQWPVGLEAGDKASAPLDMVLRVLCALELDVTLSGAAPKRRFGDDQPPMPTASEILARYGGGR